MVSVRSLPIPYFLTGIAHRYLVFEGKTPEDAPFVQTIIPTLTAFITFNLNGTPQKFYTKDHAYVLRDCVISGLQTSPFDGHLGGNIKLVALQLTPPALSRLFNTPVHLLTNVNTRLVDLIGYPAKALCDRLLNTNHIDEATALIEDFLFNRLLDFPATVTQQKIYYAQEKISRARGVISIREMSDEMDISERSLERIFMNHVGVTPKLYTRMQKFSEVIWNFNNNRELSGDLVYKLGYYDQAHFINDFKRFAGKSPQAYFKMHPGWNEFFTSLQHIGS